MNSIRDFETSPDCIGINYATGDALIVSGGRLQNTSTDNIKN